MEEADGNAVVENIEDYLPSFKPPSPRGSREQYHKPDIARLLKLYGEDGFERLEALRDEVEKKRMVSRQAHRTQFAVIFVL